jgi:hypothetical protein
LVAVLEVDAAAPVAATNGGRDVGLAEFSVVRLDGGYGRHPMDGFITKGAATAMLMPAQKVLPAVLLTLAVIGLDIANRTLNAKEPTGGSLTLEEFNKLHKEVRPPKDEVWRTIRWKLSLVEAQRLAATEQKPIFLWAMAGNPLACV